MIALFPSRVFCKQVYSCTPWMLVQRHYRRFDTPLPDMELLHRKKWSIDRVWELETFPGEFDPVPPKGKIYSNMAFPITLKADKEYKWCTCGYSNSQPFCDGAHKRIEDKPRFKKRPVFRPISFKVEKEGLYHICNCKQSSNAPFCDGTHRAEYIQDLFKPYVPPTPVK